MVKATVLKRPGTHRHRTQHVTDVGSEGRRLHPADDNSKVQQTHNHASLSP